MVRNIQKGGLILNKIKRTSLVVFLKRYIVLFSTLFLIGVSFPLGFWNVREIVFVGVKNDSQLVNSTTSFIGESIFLVKSSDLKEEIVKKNPYVKDISLEKIVPWKLEITIEEHIPLYISNSLDSCVIFSDEGYKVEEICKDCNEQCLERASTFSGIYLSSDTVVSNSNSMIFFKEFSDILQILSKFGYEGKSITLLDGIATIMDTDGHIFVFDITYDLDTQLGRMYLVGEKINTDLIEFKSLDLRFERPVMRLK